MKSNFLSAALAFAAMSADRGLSEYERGSKKDTSSPSTLTAKQKTKRKKRNTQAKKSRKQNRR